MHNTEWEIVKFVHDFQKKIMILWFMYELINAYFMFMMYVYIFSKQKWVWKVCSREHRAIHAYSWRNT